MPNHVIRALYAGGAAVGISAVAAAVTGPVGLLLGPAVVLLTKWNQMAHV